MQTSDSSIDYPGIALALGGAALFSTKPIFIKFAYAAGATSVTLLELRMLLALPFYLLIGGWLLWRQPLQPAQWRGLPVAALVGILGYYLASLLDMWGLEYISAQLERLILFAYPTLTVLLVWWWQGQRPQAGIWLALLLTYCGIATLFIQDLQQLGTEVLFGGGLVLGAAVAFAAYVVLAKAPTQLLGSRLFTCVAMSAASLAIFLHSSLSQSVSLASISWPIWAYAAAIAVVCTLLPSFMVSAAIARLGSSKTALTGTCGPVITSVLAVQLLDEPFSLWHLLAMGLVIVGVSLAMRPPQGRTPAAKSAA
ncbi:DMT family transporter [Balneatrix alpica]|uniref:DMT family transporter n=1 Tax=Balneatrix alpica TaxID=75684 RepID=A0ABV5Z9V8_9GAMM|nr:DMT family transporter [Balneatrix alpica]